MDGILSVFKLIEKKKKKKTGRFWTVLRLGKRSKPAAVVDEAHLIAEW